MSVTHLQAFIERYPKMIGQDDDVIHSIWVDKMGHPLECRVSDTKAVLDVYRVAGRLSSLCMTPELRAALDRCLEEDHEEVT